MLLSPWKYGLQVMCRGIIMSMDRWYFMLVAFRWFALRSGVVFVSIVVNFCIVSVLDVVIVILIFGVNNGRKQSGHHVAKPNDAWW